MPAKRAIVFDYFGDKLKKRNVSCALFTTIRDKFGGLLVFPLHENTAGISAVEGTKTFNIPESKAKLIWLPGEMAIPAGYGVLSVAGVANSQCYSVIKQHSELPKEFEFIVIVMNSSAGKYFKVLIEKVEELWSLPEEPDPPEPVQEVPIEQNYQSPPEGLNVYLCTWCVIFCCYFTTCCCCAPCCCRSTRDDFRDAFP